MSELKKITSNNKWFFIYIFISLIATGLGMGIPFLNILLGLPVGFYIARYKLKEQGDFSTITRKSLKYSFITIIITLLLMSFIWLPPLTLIADPNFNLTDFGMPLILFDPLLSFIGWMILMVIFAPFLQFLLTFTIIQVIMYNDKRKMDLNG